MDSESLPPIPTPVGQRWREFRIRAFPPLVFVMILVGLFFTWSNFVQPVSMVGMVETNSVNVVTTSAGLLTGLAINRFDEVTNGQVIGVVELFDLEQIAAEVKALESADTITRAKEEVLEWGKLDNAIATRLNFYVQMALLDTSTVNYEQASNVVETDRKLILPPNPTISEAVYRRDVATRDALYKEMTNRTTLIMQFTKELAAILPMQTNVFTNLDAAVKSDIDFQKAQLLQLQKPIVLRAPISGKVSAVLHHSGERVPAGAPIVTITSAETRRIIAYVRQPINYHPKLGDVISVRTRTARRLTMDAQVVKVGTQLEPIGSLLLPLAKTVPEIGLPIALTLPPELNLLPGEVVDLKLPRN